MRRATYRLAAAAGFLAAACGLAAPAAAADGGDVVNVAIRQDAPPFAELKPGEDGSRFEHYQGYMVSICQNTMETVAVALGFRVHIQPVKAGERFKVMGDETGAGEREVDVVCGPFSITEDRLAKFAFSFPVFLSGISYAAGPAAFGPSMSDAGRKIGILANTTAAEGLLKSDLDGMFGAGNAYLRQELTAVARGEAGSAGTDGSFRNLRIVSSYDEGFERLCGQLDGADGQIDYLVGDVDIVFTMSNRIAVKYPKCDITVSRITYSREIYAIVFSEAFLMANPEANLHFYLEFQRRLFMLLQTDRIRDYFRDSFGKEREMSRELRRFLDSYRRMVE